jgi:hypothetical protein
MFACSATCRDQVRDRCEEAIEADRGDAERRSERINPTDKSRSIVH